jgi:hypothetical protein
MFANGVRIAFEVNAHHPFGIEPVRSDPAFERSKISSLDLKQHAATELAGHRAPHFDFTGSESLGHQLAQSLFRKTSGHVR